MITEHQMKFLRKIADEPGIAAEFLPRAKRGTTLKDLEMAGLIHYGPGGWYVSERGAAALEQAK